MADLRPLVWLSMAHGEIKVDEEIPDMPGLNFDQAMEVSIDSMLEGMLEVDVDDREMSSAEADHLHAQAIEILYADRDTEWSNPA